MMIYDITGKEVSVLVNEELKPGIYQAQWNATGFSSGVYFYRLIVSGASTSLHRAGSTSFSQTRKMILIK
jgi:hypothetical protein